MRITFSSKLLLLTLVICVIIISLSYNQLAFNGILTKTSPKPTCPAVLDQVTRGSWKMNPMSSEQAAIMHQFLQDARGQFALPKSLQRDDGLCGNVTFPGRRAWFRALCNPNGSTPCCYHNKCLQRPVAECQCEDCYDLRKPIHAEYSDWNPSDPNCQLRYFTHLEACELLKGKTIFISGDSYMRHIYTAMLLTLRNNTHDGAMKEETSQDLREKCSGMYMFTEKSCRHLLDRKPHDLCNGKINLIFEEFYNIELGKSFVYKVENLTRSRDTFILCGIGLHANLNSHEVMNKYVLPALQVLKNKPRSRLVFASPHCPGILKSTWNGQSKKTILRFTSEMEKHLKPLDISVFNTCPITKGVVSFDGSHYGLGINMMKVQILLNYIQELHFHEMW